MVSFSHLWTSGVIFAGCVFSSLAWNENSLVGDAAEQEGQSAETHPDSRAWLHSYLLLVSFMTNRHNYCKMILPIETMLHKSNIPLFLSNRS